MDVLDATVAQVYYPDAIIVIVNFLFYIVSARNESMDTRIYTQ